MSALDAIRQRAEAATPGPWVHDEEGYMGCGEVYTMGEGVEGGNIAAPSGDCYPRSGYSPKEDMEFIAHARTDIPRLLGALDAVLALADEWSEEWTAKTPLSSQQAAAIMRRAVNDALEADK